VRAVTRPLASDGDRFVRDDPEQPVPHRTLRVVAVPRAEGLQQRPAGRVLSGVAVAEDAEGDAVELVLVLANGVGERHMERAREGARKER
jgi:hypothetical protein